MTVVTPNGDRFVIDGGTLSGDGRNLFHSFKEFGLSADQIATFLSNPSIQNILSRVTGGNPSIINGAIEVVGGNSNLFLMNPAGIVFGTGASLNVPADFTATTATGIGFEGGWFKAIGTNDYANLVGNPNGFQFHADPAGAIINAGDLAVNPGQNLSLLGGTVVNTGTLKAPGGDISVTAVPGTSRVRLSQEGQLLSLEVELPKTAARDAMPVRGLDLPALLTGSGKVETGLQVTPAQAVKLTESGTTIPTDPGTTVISGEVDASNPQGIGGEINLLGDRVGVIGADIDASGQRGGGTVLIGGEYKGQGTIPNAEVTVIDKNSMIRVDAIENGRGGRAIAWADKTTAFGGNISARGGANSGNGGFVEVSGKDHLIYRGNVDVSAPNGNPGTLLLDPENIRVVNGAEGGQNDSALSDGQILAGESPEATFTISERTLESTQGNVVLEANNNITIDDLGDNALSLSGDSISFRADADSSGAGAFLMNSGDAIATEADDISISGARLTVGLINTRPSGTTAPGGNVNLRATNGAIALTGFDGNENSVLARSITINTPNRLSVAGSLNARSDGSVGSGNVTIGNTLAPSSITFGAISTRNLGGGDGGNINIRTTGSLNATDSFTADGNPASDPNNPNNRSIASEAQGSGGNITINAGESITTAAGVYSNSRITGDGGNIRLTAGGNIRTGTVDSSSPTGNGGNITVTSNNGAITTTGLVDSTSNVGTSGDINFTAANNITTGTILSASQSGTGGDITLTSNNEGINTTTGLSPTIVEIEATFGEAFNISGIETFTGLVSGAAGNGGKIQLTAARNITTANLLSSSILQGQSGTITINSTNGAIDTRAAQDFSANIITPQGQITRQFAGIDLSSPAGNGQGTLRVNGSNLTISSDIFTDGNLVIDSNLSFASPVTMTTGSRGGSIGISGQINGQQSLNLEAGTGSVVLLSPIGTTTPLSSLNISANTIRIDDIGTPTTAGVSGATNLNATTAITFTGNTYNANQQIYTARNSFNIAGGFTSFISSRDNITFAPGTINLLVPSLPSLTILSNGGNVSVPNIRATNSIATVPNEQRIISQLTSEQPENESTSTGETIRPGFNTNILALNDDGFTGLVPIGFRVGFFGRNFTRLYVNNNGNVTFDEVLSEYTPFDLTSRDRLIIAPFFADVDTRNLASGVTRYGRGTVDGRSAFGVTWRNVGYYEQKVDKTNSFQVVLIDRSDTGANNFDIEFNYDRIQWETGDESGGTNGLGGSSARIGYSNGTRQPGTFFELPGSAVDGAFLDGNENTGLVNRSLNSDQLGRYVFEARNNIVETPRPTVTIDAGTGTIDAGNIGVTGQPIGEVNLSGGGNINTGNINARSVTINSAEGGINAGNLNTSSSISNGGNVTLDASNDIVLSTINAQGGTNGRGGDVNITTDRFFRATDTFPARDGQSASISAINGGNITINHGGNGVTPFTIGDASLNGTAGEITRGENAIATGSFRFNEIDGGIAILSGIQPPTTPEEPTEPTEPTENLFDETTQNNSDPGQFQSSPPTQLAATVPPPVIPISTLDQAREILRAIEQEAAVKPALIYVSFNPAAISVPKDFAQREANLTNEYEGFLALPQDKAQPTISIPPSATDELELLAITAEGEPIRIRIPEANRELVLQTAARFYNRVSNLQDNYLQPSQQLYRWLLAPIEAELQARGIQNYLFIMPDGLRLLPLAALHDGKQYVAQKYSTGFAPSLNLIDYRYRNIKESPVLAFGASQFEANQNQTNLPAVEIEVPLIARDIRKGTYILDKDFTLQNLIDNREDNPYPIIHLATHADFQPGELSKSYIQLYDRKIGLNELRQLGLNDPTVDLLVISACRSAYGDRNAELGFAGLAVQAGVKTAIASLWYVGDTGTLGLMSEFYRQLNTAPIKAEALRSAQVAMIEGQLKKQGNEIVGTRGTVPLPPADTVADEDLTHPFYWAAFTTIGSPW